MYRSIDKNLFLFLVGISVNDDDGLKYLYEGHEEFSVLPTYGIIIAMDAILKHGIFTGGIPGLSFDLSKVSFKTLS